MSDLSKHRQTLFCKDEKAILEYETAMNRAIQAVKNWLDDDKMYTGGSIHQLRSQIRFLPSKEGLGLDGALERAIDLFLNKSLKVHHPHSLAHLHCPTMVASQVAEVLINATNQSMDSWDQSPSGSLMEVLLIDWLRQKVGFETGDAGVFTSGGTQSNLMGVLLARDACIAKHYQTADGKPWSVQRNGLPPEAIQKVKVLCSENAHFSVQKNMAMMGMGFESVVACIVATAGTTDAGAIDDMNAIRDIADACGAWLHIDAAWGGALILSNQYRHLLQGIEKADSVTLDFHKHYFQTISCGAFLLKDKDNYRFMHYEAEYLNSAYDEEHGVPNLVSKSLQTTRRFDALKLWLTVEALGEDLYGSMIDHGVDLTREVAEYIKNTDELELLVEPQFASVLFRVVPKNYPEQFIDSLNQNVADELFARGEANIGVTRVIDKNRNVQSLKMTTLSPIATLDDVKTLLNDVLKEAYRIKADIQNGTYTPPIA